MPGGLAHGCHEWLTWKGSWQCGKKGCPLLLVQPLIPLPSVTPTLDKESVFLGEHVLWVQGLGEDPVRLSGEVLGLLGPHGEAEDLEGTACGPSGPCLPLTSPPTLEARGSVAPEACQGDPSVFSSVF